MCFLFVFFFFSSRRRHTRSLCDWSSDVCSSDLYTNFRPVRMLPGLETGLEARQHADRAEVGVQTQLLAQRHVDALMPAAQIGRASCRERGEVPGDGVVMKKERRMMNRKCRNI